MTQTRILTCRAVVLAAAMAVALAGCGKSSGDVPAEGAAFATNPPKTAAPTTLPIGAECSADAVKAGTVTKYPDATIGVFKCTSTFAIAAIFPKGGPKAGLAGFFTAVDNAWVLGSDTAANGDVAGAAPPDFPGDLVKDWLASYSDPTKQTTTTAGGSTGGGGATGGCGSSSNEGPPSSCTTTTTRATTTTATSQSTTSQSTTTAAPTTTKAPTTTTTKAGGGGLG